MREQRKRYEEWRKKRLKNVKEASEKKKKAKPKKSAYEQYFEGQKGKKGVTRPSGGASKKGLVNAPKPAEKKPAKPPVVSTPKPKDSAKNKAKAIRNFSQSASGTRGEFLPSNPQLKSQPKKKKAAPKLRSGGSRAYVKPRKTSGPKVGDTKRTRVGSRYVTKRWNGDKWVTKK